MYITYDTSVGLYAYHEVYTTLCLKKHPRHFRL